MRRLSALVVLAVTTATLYASGCGSAEPRAVRATDIATAGSASPVAPPMSPTTPSANRNGGGSPTPAISTPDSTPGQHRAHVTGSATDENFDGVAGVVIVFEPQAGCAGCARGSAVTGEDGSYALDLASGSYQVACAIDGRECGIDTDTEPVRVARAQLTAGSHTITMAVTSTGGGADQQTDGDGADPNGSDSGGDSGGSASDATFSGHVYDESGSPVAGVTVEFKSLCDSCDQAWTKSGVDGSYAINLAAGTYNAMCIDDNCGPRGGDGGPHPVDVPPDHQTLDFIVCSEDDYPDCLGR